MALTLIYIANTIVAGWVGISSLYFPKLATTTVFAGAYPESEVMRLAGALWTGIALLSLMGLFRPISFSPVLILQVFYKGSWLVFVALPAILQGSSYPKAMALFFLIWVIILPFFIPWKQLFA